MAQCEVCCGEGTYPIHNRKGKHVYDIKCPECWGISEERAAELERKCAEDAAVLQEWRAQWKAFQEEVKKEVKRDG
jgi:hypothetical protein